MSELALRAWERIHGHLGWLAAVALMHPAILLRRPKRRASLVAALAVGGVTIASGIGAWLYPMYRRDLKQTLFLRAPSIGWLFERKEHLAVGALVLAWTGLLAHWAVAWSSEQQLKELLAKIAYRSFVASSLLALLTAVLGTIVSTWASFLSSRTQFFETRLQVLDAGSLTAMVRRLNSLEGKRNAMRSSLSLLMFSTLASLVFACASAKDDGYIGSTIAGTGGTETNGGSAGVSAGQGGDAAGGAGASAGGAGQGGNVVIGGQGGASIENLLIYAHTDLTLYQMDPKNLDAGLTEIGPFDCVGDKAAGQDEAMTDLAVDRDQNIWGVSWSAVHRLEIQEKKVVCKDSIKLHAGSQSVENIRFYGLTFAPAGTIDKEKEVLVAGNTAGELWAIDAQGNLKLLGHFGDVPANDGHGNKYTNVGKRWELSGDIVFVEGKDEPLGFATVRDCPNPPNTQGCNKVNTLIELDMKKLGKAAPGSMTKAVRGQIVQRQGCEDGLDGNYGNMYGISAWGNRIYGFSREGHLVDIAISNGAGCAVQTFDSIKFAGAGITTIAPVEKPINLALVFGVFVR